MFGSWSSLAALGPRDNKRPSSPSASSPKKPRVPSPPLVFPHYLHPSPHSPFSNSTVNDFYSLFQGIRRATNITPTHLQALNISVSYDLPLAKLIPKKYHADETDEKGAFQLRKKELETDNQAAWDYIGRVRRDVRIGNFYKFFQSLEFISSYYGPDATTEGSMPGMFREEAVRHLVDPISWGFDARLFAPRAPPKIHLRKSVFNQKTDFYLYRQPLLSTERREGIVEGPLLSLQTRHDAAFSSDADLIDTMREVAAMLGLAQERSQTQGSVVRRVRYEAIGREAGLGGDDIFLISSIHNHLSLSHVFLTDAYLRYIKTGEVPSTEYCEKYPDWCEFRLGKSKWLSYLEPEGRVDCLRIIMAVIGWLMRDGQQEQPQLPVGGDKMES